MEKEENLMGKLSQIKEKGENLCAEIMVDATTTLATRGITKKDIKIAKAVTIGGMAAVGAASVFALASSGAFNDIANKLITLLKNLYKNTVKLVTVVAVALLGICIVLSMTSKDERRVTEFKEWGKRIVIAWAIFMLLGNVITVIESFGSNTSGILEKYGGNG